MIRTASVELQLTDAGILVLVALPLPGHHTVEQAEENIEAIASLTRGTPRPFLTDIRDSAPTPRNTRQAYAAVADQYISAQAVIVGSTFSRINGNLFLRLLRPKYPTRLFTDLDEANAWLTTNFLS